MNECELSLFKSEWVWMSVNECERVLMSIFSFFFIIKYSFFTVLPQKAFNPLVPTCKKVDVFCINIQRSAALLISVQLIFKNAKIKPFISAFWEIKTDPIYLQNWPIYNNLSTKSWFFGKKPHTVHNVTLLKQWNILLMFHEPKEILQNFLQF